jgi:3-hydroxyacyl-CoA dehydrogenase
MALRIKSAAVIGSGVMGSGIAAHLANCGIKVLLLDIVPPNLTGADREVKAKRNAIPQGNLEKAIKAKPVSAFYHARLANLVEVGNTEDDLQRAAQTDWVIEAIPEVLKFKTDLFGRLDGFKGPNTIITSNTSGLKIADMTAGRTPEFKKRFFVTHFFNPVRIMELLELVPGTETDPALYADFTAWGERTLGKGIVHGKDTTNFVANRIGVFSMMNSIKVMEAHDLPFEAVDKITGKAMGRPGSAAFGTADLVGLDTFAHVTDSCYENLPNDEKRDVFKKPEWFEKMLANKWLGNKTGAGFYKKEGKEKLVLDRKTLTYVPQQKWKADSLGQAKGIEDTGARVKFLVNAQDAAGKFAWEVTRDALVYSAFRLGEIADDVFNIDNAMKWGFRWEAGPFESWDAIGFRETVERIKAEGVALPKWVEDLYAKGGKGFYKKEGGRLYFYDALGTGDYKPAPVDFGTKGDVKLWSVKQTGGLIKENTGASLYDIGDGVALVEFHTKMNAIDADIVGMLNEALDYISDRNDFAGLVIGNEAEHFSAGANLMLLYMFAQSQDWASIEMMISEFQKVTQRIKYFHKPVVAAPHGYTFGGGAEVVFAAHRVRAAAETYMGLVEVGAGLIPGGGGNKEMLIRVLEHKPEGVEVDLFPYLRKAFEAIATAKVALSGVEAKAHNFLRDSDRVTININQLIGDAKRMVLGMHTEGFAPPVEPTFFLPGKSMLSNFEFALWNFTINNMASEHDAKIGKKLAYVLCGGDTHIKKPLTEQFLLDLEREAFLSLCGEEKSQARMAALLTDGKPLRN